MLLSIATAGNEQISPTEAVATAARAVQAKNTPRRALKVQGMQFSI